MAAFNLASKMAAKLSFQSFLSSLGRTVHWAEPLSFITSGESIAPPSLKPF